MAIEGGADGLHVSNKHSEGIKDDSSVSILSNCVVPFSQTGLSGEEPIRAEKRVESRVPF